MIRTVAKKAFEQADSDWQEAEKLFNRWVRHDAVLREAVTPLLIADAIHRTSEDMGRSTRQRAWRKGPSEPNSATSRGLQLMSSDALLNYPLRKGEKLGDATKKDLAVEIEDFKAKAATLNLRGRWFELISKQLRTEDEKVSDNLRESDLRHLQEKAQKEMA